VTRAIGSSMSLLVMGILRGWVPRPAGAGVRVVDRVGNWAYGICGARRRGGTADRLRGVARGAGQLLHGSHRDHRAARGPAAGVRLPVGDLAVAGTTVRVVLPGPKLPQLAVDA